MVMQVVDEDMPQSSPCNYHVSFPPEIFQNKSTIDIALGIVITQDVLKGDLNYIT